MAMALERLGVAVRIVDKAYRGAPTSQRPTSAVAAHAELLDVQGCAQPFIAARR